MSTVNLAGLTSPDESRRAALVTLGQVLSRGPLRPAHLPSSLWLTKYVSRGFHLVSYPAGKKGPEGPEAKNWPTRSFAVTGYRPGDNIGVKLGVETTPGRFLVDVDLDSPEAVRLAKALLPSTGFGFGRLSKPISHAFYTSPAAVVTQSFNDGSGRPLLELRGTKADGAIGFQTMVPPSLHPSGERIKMSLDGEIAHVDDLPRRVVLLAVVSLLLRHLGPRGFGHNVRLAVAGFLLQCDLTEAEVVAVGQALAEATGNDMDDVASCVRDTQKRLARRQPVTGARDLADAIGDANGDLVVGRIRQWLGGEFQRDSHGKVVPSQDNIRLALTKLDVELWLDGFASRGRLSHLRDANRLRR